MDRGIPLRYCLPTMECHLQCDFVASYDCSALPAIKALEREVLGCDYGGTSWTTREQAERIRSSLALDTDSHLLEIGSGSGWPALYLSVTTGCHATLVDLPLNALENAVERAAADSIGDRIDAVNGNAIALPLADASFDRLSHSDVLCCLEEKAAMLVECRRVAAADALMHFFVIEPAHGLAPDDHWQALEYGPPFVDMDKPYEDLLHEAGWQLDDRINVGADYIVTINKLTAAMVRDSSAFEEAFGVDGYRDELEKNQGVLPLVEAGILRRFIYIANAR